MKIYVCVCIKALPPILLTKAARDVPPKRVTFYFEYFALQYGGHFHIDSYRDVPPKRVTFYRDVPPNRVTFYFEYFALQ